MLDPLSLCEGGLWINGIWWTKSDSPSEGGDRTEVDCEVVLENEESDRDPGNCL